jgi:hypothetical protein
MIVKAPLLPREDSYQNGPRGNSDALRATVDIIQGGKKVVSDVTQIREYLESERNRLREELQLKIGE